MTLDPRFLNRPYAHRGLWRPNGAPENSLAAFRAAAAAGYGVELDVRLTADGEAAVFHDAGLERLTGGRGLVIEHDMDALRATALGEGETVPDLAQALDVLAEVPVLVELKTEPGQEGPLEDRVAALLVGRAGPVSALSFNPAALSRVRAAAPAVPVGLNVDRLEILDRVEVLRPDYVSVRRDLADAPRIRALRRAGLPVAVWTLRTPAELEAARPYADMPMFEGFEP